MREPEAAVAIVRTPEPESRILLMRRAEREGDSWSGHWSLPGGRREQSDNSLLETAMRELHEECGIRLLPEQLSASLPVTIARRRTGPFLLVAPFVFDVESELPTVLDPREAVGTLWIPQRMLLDPEQHSFQCVAGLPPEVRFPAIRLPGAPLWGFTYRLLMEWLNISPRDCSTTSFDVARIVLDFLLLSGLKLRSDWSPGAPHDSDEYGPVQLAEVSGPIPTNSVLEHFAAPGLLAARINRLEVRPEYIRIHGLAFEEYLIQAVPG